MSTAVHDIFAAVMASFAGSASTLAALCLTLAVAPACAPVVRSAVSGLDADSTSVAADDETAYLCPMHPDVTSSAPGLCPRCSMQLVLGTPFDMRDYQVEFRTEPPLVTPGEPVRLFFRVLHPDTGATVTNFERVHDKPYHLFVISMDMEFFEHIHPEQGEDGSWWIDVTLPRAGHYKVLSDFAPQGASSQFIARPLVTAGYEGDLVADGAQLTPDASASKTVGDLTATVRYDPAPMLATVHSHLTFTLTKAGSNAPVHDLQAYLGAFGHMLIMSEDMIQYVHSHPLENLPVGADPETVRGGPSVIFEALMPRPGRYRAWTQFRHQDRIHTFPFTFEVAGIGASR
jgi:hypothetical protein